MKQKWRLLHEIVFSFSFIQAFLSFSFFFFIQLILHSLSLSLPSSSVGSFLVPSIHLSVDGLTDGRWCVWRPWQGSETWWSSFEWKTSSKLEATLPNLLLCWPTKLETKRTDESGTLPLNRKSLSFFALCTYVRTTSWVVLYGMLYCVVSKPARVPVWECH